DIAIWLPLLISRGFDTFRHEVANRIKDLLYDEFPFPVSVDLSSLTECRNAVRCHSHNKKRIAADFPAILIKEAFGNLFIAAHVAGDWFLCLGVVINYITCDNRITNGIYPAGAASPRLDAAVGFFDPALQRSDFCVGLAYP